MKPLIIGQAPARGNDDKPAFSGSSGSRIARLAGIGDTGDVLPKFFDLVNLNPKYPGRDGKFDMQAAREKGKEIAMELWEAQQFDRRILMMGRKVRRAMGVPSDYPYLEWFSFWGHRAVIFPHPSGLNHWWNDYENEKAARFFLKRLLLTEAYSG